MAGDTGADDDSLKFGKNNNIDDNACLRNAITWMYLNIVAVGEVDGIDVIEIVERNEDHHENHNVSHAPAHFILRGSLVESRRGEGGERRGTIAFRCCCLTTH